MVSANVRFSSWLNIHNLKKNKSYYIYVLCLNACVCVCVCVYVWDHIYKIKVIATTVIASTNFRSIIKIESWFPALPWKGSS